MASKFPIVGGGASAGGLQGLGQMLRHVPGDAAAAFIIVTHLARGHLSSLPEILARYTPMRVETAGDRVRIEANTVYVCPPDSVLMIEGDRLRLSQAGEAMRKPIDVFLSSLGEQQGEAAVGVLLSGGGSDGTLGIKAVKGNGGLTIAQGGDGDGPMQSTMPDAAIAAGVVDLVLSAEDIGRRIVEHARSFDKLLQED